MTKQPLFNRVLRRLGVSRFLNLNQSIQINGRGFVIPVRGDLGAANLAMTELWMVRVLEKLKGYFEQHPGTFVDVGVNIGQTLLKVRSVLPDISYVGYEPNASCIYYVRELIRLNGFQRCEIVPVGVSDEADLLKLQFYYDNELDSSASMITDFRPDQEVVRTETIPVFPVSEHSFSNPVSFIKIDVEGAELEVIQGLKDVIAQDRPIVSTEILPAYNSENTGRIERQNRIFETFRAQGFHCFRLAAGHRNTDPSLEPINAIEIHSDLNACDYLWVPEEKADAVHSLVASGSSVAAA